MAELKIQWVRGKGHIVSCGVKSYVFDSIAFFKGDKQTTVFLASTVLRYEPRPIILDDPACQDEDFLKLRMKKPSAQNKEKACVDRTSKTLYLDMDLAGYSGGRYSKRMPEGSGWKAAQTHLVEQHRAEKLDHADWETIEFPSMAKEALSLTAAYGDTLHALQRVASLDEYLELEAKARDIFQKRLDLEKKAEEYTVEDFQQGHH